MSNLFFTKNNTKNLVENIPNEEKLSSIELRTSAGQFDIERFRIGNDTEENQELVIYSPDPNLSFSYQEAYGYSVGLNLNLPALTVSPTIFVKLSAEISASEGLRTSTINVGDSILTVLYFIARTNEGTTETGPFTKYQGIDTLYILQQFETQGEALILYRHDPLPKPVFSHDRCLSLDEFDSFFSVAEWCNPQNPLVGYKPVSSYPTFGFVGDHDLAQDIIHKFPDGQPSFKDVSIICLPPDFQGFNPTYVPVVVPFGSVSFRQKGYQRTQWTIKRRDAQYALSNIRQQGYFRNQFLFYVADLTLVNYPGFSSDEGFLPWNQIYDEKGKIIHYIQSFSRREYDSPYQNPYNSSIIGGT